MKPFYVLHLEDSEAAIILICDSIEKAGIAHMPDPVRNGCEAWQFLHKAGPYKVRQSQI